jgi:hypothetical protein
MSHVRQTAVSVALQIVARAHPIRFPLAAVPRSPSCSSDQHRPVSQQPRAPPRGAAPRLPAAQRASLVSTAAPPISHG